jgi:hypothetical protein
MRQATVPISQRTRDVLQEIARAEHESIQVVLERAVEEYRRKRFLEDVNADYASLRQDREAWDSLESERAEWDAVLGDGLPEGENWGAGAGYPSRAKS